MTTGYVVGLDSLLVEHKRLLSEVINEKTSSSVCNNLVDVVQNCLRPCGLNKDSVQFHQHWVDADERDEKLIRAPCSS